MYLSVSECTLFIILSFVLYFINYHIIFVYSRKMIVMLIIDLRPSSKLCIGPVFTTFYLIFCDSAITSGLCL